MNWNTENIDPVGDLLRMKEAHEKNVHHSPVTICKSDKENAEYLGLVEGRDFIVAEYVPEHYVCISDVFIPFSSFSRLFMGETTALSILTEPLNISTRMNRAQRRKAEREKRKNGSCKTRKE
jgi:hypothetical protein